jgi:hypothetical protein
MDSNFLACGASMFWAFWGYLNDQPRTAQNIQFLADRGIQYIRVFGAVGPSGIWQDRIVDPSMPHYDTLIATFTDWVYDIYGIRVEWCIMAGLDHLPSSASRTRLVTTFGNMASGREQKIFLIEIANEPQQNGPGLAELRQLALHLQGMTSVLVAPGAAISGDPGFNTQAIYAPPISGVTTYHMERSQSGSGGVWRPMRQPWDVQFVTGVPVLSSCDEPIGPESSVASDDNPLRLAMMQAVCYIGGVGAYTLHCGAGIRGGGAGDVARNRKANFWEQPGIDTILGAFRNVRAFLPSDVPSWSRHNTNANFPNRPWDFYPREQNISRVYNATKDNRFVSAVLGVTGDISLQARRTMTAVEVYDIVSGTTIGSTSLNAGQTLQLNQAGWPEGFLIKGTFV